METNLKEEYIPRELLIEFLNNENKGLANIRNKLKKMALIYQDQHLKLFTVSEDHNSLGLS